MEYQEEADVRIIIGDQRAGKSTVATGFAIDDYYENLTGIVSSAGELVTAKHLTEEDMDGLVRQGIRPDPFHHVKIFDKGDRRSSIIKMPLGYHVVSPVKIFANYTLYGVRYVHVDRERLIEHFNSPLLTEGWLLSDEGGMTDNRDSMTKEGKTAAKFGAQTGKRNLHFCIISQYYRMIELRYKLFKTTTVLCDYDKPRKQITVTMTKKGEGGVARKYTFDAWVYWPFFDSNERIGIAQKEIDVQLAKAYG